VFRDLSGRHSVLLLVGVDLGRQIHAMRGWQASGMSEESVFAFDFSFSFDLPAVRRKPSVAGRVGWLGA
jgi:hypothetical protein